VVAVKKSGDEILDLYLIRQQTLDKYSVVVAVKKSGDEILRSLPDKTADIRQVFSSSCCEVKRRFYDLYVIRR
jgi:hypothetical protein